MKIYKLTASYGKLNNETLKLHDGLNIVEAPNESGKSTWCSFIRSMLYGVSSSERTKDGYLPDKIKYAPWSGIPMEGTMDIEADGSDITLSRRTSGRNAPMKDFSACYTGTAIKVPGINPSDAGEILTGVSRDVFCRTAFVEQGNTVISGSAELEKQIQSVLTSGEADVSYSEAEGRLRSWMRKRRHNNRGRIPELQEAIDAVQGDIIRMSDTADFISECEQKLAACRSEKDAAEKELTGAVRQKKERLIASMEEYEKESKSLSEEYDSAFDELNAIRSRMRESLLGRLNSASPEGDAECDIERIKELKAVKPAIAVLLAAVMCFLVSVFGTAVYRYVYTNTAVLIVSGACCILSVALFAVFLVRNMAAKHASKEIRSILQKYSAENIRDIDKSISEYLLLAEEESVAEERLKSAAGRYNLSRSRIVDSQRRLINDTDSTDEEPTEANLMKRLDKLRDDELRLVSDIAAGNATLHSMGDPMVLKTELDEMNAARVRLEHEYEAIRLASEVLMQADNELQCRFSPELGRKAAEYMSFLTDGKYSEMLINRDFSASLLPENGIASMDSLYYSAGTLDCIYLSVRLAVCELALPKGETCPLIIDDALVNLDEERYKRALKLLEKISEYRQVILFTCRKQ